MSYLKTRRSISAGFGGLLLVLAVTSVLYSQSVIHLPIVGKQDDTNPSASQQERHVYLPIVAKEGQKSQQQPTGTQDSIEEEHLGNGWIRYTNHDLGFSIEYPEGWYVELVRDNKACITKFSPSERPVMNYPMVCVNLNPDIRDVQVELSNLVTSSSNMDVKEYLRAAESSETTTARSRIQVSSEYDYHLGKAIEVKSSGLGDPNGAGIEVPNLVVVKILVSEAYAKDVLFEMIDFDEASFRQHEHLMRSILDSFSLSSL